MGSSSSTSSCPRTIASLSTLDPSVCRRGHSPDRQTSARPRSSTITKCVLSRKRSDQRRGHALLQRFSEPKETRLGLSKHGIDGHGGGDEIGQAIWEALTNNLLALVTVGILKYIEDMPVFVENVANDRTSDLTTRIVFEPLARFTRSMVATHPEFTRGRHETQTFSRQVWEPSKKRWRDKDLDLPVAEGKPLILVPRDWARPHLLMSSGRYFETTILGFAQERRTVFDKSTGKALKPPKESLKQLPGLARGVETIARVTLEAHGLDQDLVARFREFVDEKYERLSDDDIAKRTM
jgi:hypothetical protein